ncbi:MAG: hypothetical protein PVJ57_07900 [Phycisphaerae bacterium]|jgi:hypothetical protein
MTRCCGLLLLPVLLLGLAGCTAAGPRPLTPVEQAVADAARPILEMDPDAVWTDCYNRLVDLAPASLTYLAEQPDFCHPAAPDSLPVLTHTSLVRLLIQPGLRPAVTATCLDTSLDVLYFDLKVGGERLGTPLLASPSPPATWHELYAGKFDHHLAGRIDVEADRQVLHRWWLENRDRASLVAECRRLRPQPEPLWKVLSRRPADRWEYQPEVRAVRCSTQAEPVMISTVTYDYNLVRATCIWLGASGRPDVREGLIGLVASPSAVIAHNALFSLAYVPDERIRDVLRRYKETQGFRPRSEPAEPRASTMRT